jgi:dephospho-CoA kinase
MIVLGLTGSIGMGKSTALSMFAEEGAATWSADEAVARLYARGGAAVGPVGAAFPSALKGDAVDRERLAEIALGDPEALMRLEAIVHPLVGEDRRAFLEAARARGEAIAVLDVPLLFETGRERDYDVVIVVSAPADVQKVRALKRPGMTPEKLAAILTRQSPDSEKRARADYVIDTNGPLEETRAQIRRVLADARQGAAP